MPTLIAMGIPSIRGRTMTAAFTGLGSIVTTTTADTSTMVTIPVSGTTRPFTVGPIVRGARRYLGALDRGVGDGPGHHGTATTADTLHHIRCIRRRHFGLPTI